MTSSSMHSAKTNLSRLIAKAEAGEDVVIMRGAKPVVRLVPIGEDARHPRVIGALAGQVRVDPSRLPGAGPLAVDFASEVVARGFTPLDISLAHGQDAGSLPGAHQDPFDRMLIAQARTERMALVSNEVAFDQYGVVRVW